MTKRERTIAMIVGVAAGAYALDSLLITPQLNARTLIVDQVQKERNDLEADQTLIRRMPVNQSLWRQNMAKGLMSDPLEAVDQLANHLNLWAAQQQLTVSTLQVNQAPQPVNKPGGKLGEKEPGFMKVSVQCSATGQMAQIANFLSQIQSAEIPIRISDMRISTKAEGTDSQELVLTVSTIILRSDAKTDQVSAGGARGSATAPTSRPASRGGA